MKLKYNIIITNSIFIVNIVYIINIYENNNNIFNIFLKNYIYINKEIILIIRDKI